MRQMLRTTTNVKNVKKSNKSKLQIKKRTTRVSSESDCFTAFVLSVYLHHSQPVAMEGNLNTTISLTLSAEEDNLIEKLVEDRTDSTFPSLTPSAGEPLCTSLNGGQPGNMKNITTDSSSPSLTQSVQEHFSVTVSPMAPSVEEPLRVSLTSDEQAMQKEASDLDEVVMEDHPSSASPLFTVTDEENHSISRSGKSNSHITCCT